MFRELRPSPPLRGVVDRFWICDCAFISTSDDPFEVLPDGCAEVVFALGDARGQMLAFGTATQGRTASPWTSCGTRRRRGHEARETRQVTTRRAVG